LTLQKNHGGTGIGKSGGKRASNRAKLLCPGVPLGKIFWGPKNIPQRSGPKKLTPPGQQKLVSWGSHNPVPKIREPIKLNKTLGRISFLQQPLNCSIRFFFGLISM